MSKWKIVRIRSDLHRRLKEVAREMGEYYANHPYLFGPEAREDGSLALTDAIGELLRRTECHKRRARKARRKATKATERDQDVPDANMDSSRYTSPTGGVFPP